MPQTTTEAKKARDVALKARPTETRAKVKARAERYADVAFQIKQALSGGQPFHWMASENHYIQVAADMGLTIITQRRAEKAGYTLKRKQKPVGTIYFGAPISRIASVYVLECQFKKAEESK